MANLDHQGSYRLGMTLPEGHHSQEQVLTGPALFSTDLQSLQTMLVSAGCFSTPVYSRALEGKRTDRSANEVAACLGGNNSIQRL